MAYAAMFERWQSEADNFRFWVLLDLGRLEEYPLDTHGWFFGVRVPLAEKSEDGLPSEMEERRLNAVENRIREKVRERDGVYVGRRTGAGNRDILCYFEAKPRGLEERIRASIGMEILFMSRPDPDWEGFEAMLPSPKQYRQIDDWKTIDGLINAGANPNATHSIEHRVTTSSPKGAEALAALMGKLELDNVEVTGSKPELVVTGTLLASLIDIEPINRVSYILESKSPKARGQYEGWSANPEFEEVDETYGEEDDMPDLDSLIRALASQAPSSDEA